MEPSRDLIVGVGDGLTIGSLLFMGLYALYLYGLNRDSAYLFYALYSGISCYMFLTEYASYVINVPFYLRKPDIEAFSYIPYSLFIARLVEVPRHSPRGWRVLLIVLAVYFVITLRVVLDSSVGYTLFNSLFRSLLNLHVSALFLPVIESPKILLLTFILAIVWRSRSYLKGYLVGMILLTLVTVLGPMIYHVVSIAQLYGRMEQARPSAAAQPQRAVARPPDKKPTPGVHTDSVLIPVGHDVADTFSHLGLVLQGLCFAFALAYRSRRLEQENDRIRATYTEQLEQELAERTQELIAQERRLEEQRFHQLELAFEHQQAETKMTALRAQMNPHFIFNCLNSIKLYATDNEAAKASQYLTKFSKLIRLVLENSRSERVTLANELQALQLYLEMEAMRFKDKLRFSIEVASGIDTEFMEIPPLLIQPYVENAIWHGLMHKEAGGTVWIRVEQPQENLLQVTVKDDGVGRAKAVELKSKSATKGKSFGMKMTGERIALINQVYHTQTDVQIYDLTNVQGQPAGTEVVLRIPI